MDRERYGCRAVSFNRSSRIECSSRRTDLHDEVRGLALALEEPVLRGRICMPNKTISVSERRGTVTQVNRLASHHRTATQRHSTAANAPTLPSWRWMGSGRPSCAPGSTALRIAPRQLGQEPAGKSEEKLSVPFQREDRVAGPCTPSHVTRASRIRTRRNAVATSKEREGKRGSLTELGVDIAVVKHALQIDVLLGCKHATHD